MRSQTNSSGDTMLLSEAEQIFKLLYAEMQNSGKEITILYNDMITKAVDYAGIRSEWLLMSYEERKESLEEKKLLLNSFIVTVNVLSEAMEKKNKSVTWRSFLGSDAKRIGDWACYLSLFYALNSR